jgi:hypothetical protein
MSGGEVQIASVSDSIALQFAEADPAVGLIWHMHKGIGKACCDAVHSTR